MMITYTQEELSSIVHAFAFPGTITDWTPHGNVRIAVVADAQRRAVGFAHFERFRCVFEREGRRGVGRFVSVRTVRSGEAEACCGEDQGAGHDE